jgi:predicted flap endonuclease-1-like 5' DNA nuclease
MLYLASQFAWFLVAAFGMGCAMGWLSRDGSRRQLWHPGLGYLAVIVALVAAASWSQWLNGVAALWAESALLFIAAYLAGCLLGALLKPQLAREPVPPAKAATPSATSPAAPALAKVENEDAIPGQRPAGLAAARNAAPDDLKVIKGVGPQNEQRLHALGIFHFEQIANWTPANVEWVGSYLAFPGRIEREEWIEQARELAAKPAKERA